MDTENYAVFNGTARTSIFCSLCFYCWGIASHI